MYAYRKRETATLLKWNLSCCLSSIHQQTEGDRLDMGADVGTVRGCVFVMSCTADHGFPITRFA